MVMIIKISIRFNPDVFSTGEHQMYMLCKHRCWKLHVSATLSPCILVRDAVGSRTLMIPIPCALAFYYFYFHQQTETEMNNHEDEFHHKRNSVTMAIIKEEKKETCEEDEIYF